MKYNKLPRNTITSDNMTAYQVRNMANMVYRVTDLCLNTSYYEIVNYLN